MNISILSKTQIHIDHLVDRLKEWPVSVCRSRDDLRAAIPDTDVLIVLNQGFHFHLVDEEMLTATKRLKLIQHYGVATDATDVEAATRLNIRVATMPGQNSRSVAEHATFLLLALARQMPMGQHLLRTGGMGEAPCTELAGKTLCLVGLGIIGKMVARIALGLSMTVNAVRRNPSDPDMQGLGIHHVYPTDELDRALGEADFVMLLLPLTAGTIGLIGDAQFRAMKPTAMLINMSRGPHVDRPALKRALSENRIAGFASDVYWSEPADPQDPLLRDRRVVVTPHLGGSSIECIRRTVERVHGNLKRFERGEPVLDPVN